MKQDTYDTVLEILSRRSSFHEGLNDLRKLHPAIVTRYGEKTLRSIQAQYYVRRMRRCHHHHYGREARDKYYKLYKEAKARKEDHVICRLASLNDISPCLLGRIILEEYFLRDCDYEKIKERSDGRGTLPPGFMTDCIRDIAKIPNPELATEIYETMLIDNFYGPAVDSIKKTCGVEYEMILKRHCFKTGLLVRDEDKMREEGYDKTPDILLKIPVLFKNRVVNWIESKASFGDPISHQQYNIDQFLPYKNRFGPGAVIYWFGFIDELVESGDSGILLMDKFPDSEEIKLLKDALLEEEPATVGPFIQSAMAFDLCQDADLRNQYTTYVDPIFDSDEESFTNVTSGLQEQSVNGNSQSQDEVS